MGQKKRRFVSCLGYMREMNGDCGDLELKEEKSEEKSTSKSEMVAFDVRQNWGVLRQF